MAARKNKGSKLETAHSKPHSLRPPNKSSPSANPPRHHQPQFSEGSSDRQCISANWHPLQFHRCKSIYDLSGLIYEFGELWSSLKRLRSETDSRNFPIFSLLEFLNFLGLPSSSPDSLATIYLTIPANSSRRATVASSRVSSIRPETFPCIAN